MRTKTIKERAKQLIDNLSTDKAKLILNLLERFNEKEEWKAAKEGWAYPKRGLEVWYELDLQNIPYFQTSGTDKIELNQDFMLIDNRKGFHRGSIRSSEDPLTQIKSKLLYQENLIKPVAE